MIRLYKKYICVFFLALLAINHTFYLSHIMMAHHDGCSHHRNYQVRILDASSSNISIFEGCEICDIDLFNLFETSLNVFTRLIHFHIIQLNIGLPHSRLSVNWITSFLPQRGPPFKSLLEY
tara:strand:+ start:1396 stop:1758 length:363 start_codon:yes stop_codon:yes gene_type:complete